MVDTFVFIMVTFSVYSFNLCVYSQTLQTLSFSWFAQSLKKFENLDPLKPTEHFSPLNPLTMA